MCCIEFLGCVVCGVGVVGKVRPGLVGVKVEEEIALAADEVVRGRGPAACDADGLRVGEEELEGFVVDGGDAVETEADA